MPAIFSSSGAAAALSNPDADLLALCETARLERQSCNAAGSDEVGDLHYERGCAAIDTLTVITPQTPAGLAEKMRVLGEDEATGEPWIIRQLIYDAFAVAGIAVVEPITPSIDRDIERAAQFAEEQRLASAQREAERLALSQASSEDLIQRFLAEAVPS